jgi:hypothetical protein
MTEYQKETAFLRRAIRTEDTDQHRAIEKSIIQVQRDLRCVRRAAWLMALFLALTAAALAYGAALVDNFPFGKHQFVIRIVSIIGLASLISLMAFSGLLPVYRQRLNRLRDECRRVVADLLERQHPRANDYQLKHEALTEQLDLSAVGRCLNRPTGACSR